MIGQLAFYPSLGYNLVRNFLQPGSWAWYSRVDDKLLLGALPFKSMIADLKAEGVGGVVCCTEEFELNAAYDAVRPEDWKQHGIRLHHIPMRDFTGSTSRHDVQRALEFINDVTKEGATCYVHCKAGRTRSAMVAVCYLMAKYDHLPNAALAALSQKRPQVLLRSAHWRTIHEYRGHLDKIKETADATTE